MGRKRKNNNLNKIITTVIIFAVLLLIDFVMGNFEEPKENEPNTTTVSSYINIDAIPEYTNEIYVTINENKPYFEESEYTVTAFEKYSELDSLGRCGVAYANICKDTMPPESDERGDISSVKPTGWKQTRVNGEYLYNRCHLIAYCLSDEDANKLNLITGTRYFNVEGMLLFEKQVAQYIDKNPNNHVLYRVTPVFKEKNLLASGVEMEAYSVEDNGKGVCFNVFVYNVQPGVNINYATGEVVK